MRHYFTAALIVLSLAAPIAYAEETTPPTLPVHTEKDGGVDSGVGAVPNGHLTDKGDTVPPPNGSSTESGGINSGPASSLTDRGAIPSGQDAPHR